MKDSKKSDLTNINFNQVGNGVKSNQRKVTPSRRQILSTFAIGGGFIGLSQTPKKWLAPVIDSVILPAHAQTSIVDEVPGSPPTLLPAHISPSGSFDSNVTIVGINGASDIIFNMTSTTFFFNVVFNDSSFNQLLLIPLMRDGTAVTQPVSVTDSAGIDFNATLTFDGVDLFTLT